MTAPGDFLFCFLFFFLKKWVVRKERRKNCIPLLLFLLRSPAILSLGFTIFGDIFAYVTVFFFFFFF